MLKSTLTPAARAVLANGFGIRKPQHEHLMECERFAVSTLNGVAPSHARALKPGLSLLYASESELPRGMRGYGGDYEPKDHSITINLSELARRKGEFEANLFLLLLHELGHACDFSGRIGQMAAALDQRQENSGVLWPLHSRLPFTSARKLRSVKEQFDDVVEARAICVESLAVGKPAEEFATFRRSARNAVVLASGMFGLLHTLGQRNADGWSTLEPSANEIENPAAYLARVRILCACGLTFRVQ